MTVKMTRHHPGSMSFGQALLVGLGTAAGFLGAAMVIHFAGDVYQLGKRWLFKKPEEMQPPSGNGETVSGLFGYRR